MTVGVELYPKRTLIFGVKRFFATVKEINSLRIGFAAKVGCTSKSGRATWIAGAIGRFAGSVDEERHYCDNVFAKDSKWDAKN